MEPFTGKVAVVTGSSSGIGASISKELVKRGMKVVGLARRIERLEELKKQIENESGTFYDIKCDIRNENDILNAFEWIEEHLGGVDVLVNNAGVLRLTSLTVGLSKENTEKWKTTLDTNVLGLCIATREVVKSMKKYGIRGHIIHINSILGHRITPEFASALNVYPASKFAVRALAETLRYELAENELKIKVTNLSPGYVKTELLTAANGSQAEKTLLKDAPYLIPENIAEAVLYALSTPLNVDVSEITLQPL